MEEISVEVVYALPDAADCVALRLAPGSSALQAVRRSGILERHPEIDLASWKLGVHARIVAPDARLADGDRVEIYRPLALDPKERRRTLARERRIRR